jgi:hypothetical protein
LIIDDFALSALDAAGTADFYETVVERHRRASTISPHPQRTPGPRRAALPSGRGSTATEASRNGAPDKTIAATTDPTATLRVVSGELLSRSEASVCVSSEGADSDGEETPPVQVCAMDYDGVIPETITVGKNVTRHLVDIELDPGSGASWSLWSHMEVASE